jgi:hypothetical protein
VFHVCRQAGVQGQQLGHSLVRHVPTQAGRYPAHGASCGRRRCGSGRHSRSTPPFFSPDQGDEPGGGIAKDPLQSAASTESLSADRQAGNENNAESV